MRSLRSQQNQKEAHGLRQLQVLQLHSLLQSHEAQYRLLQKISPACGRHQVMNPGLGMNSREGTTWGPKQDVWRGGTLTY